MDMPVHLPLFFVVVLALVAGVVLFILAQTLVTAVEARNWWVVDATILESRTELENSDDDPALVVRVAYRYEVGGQSYVSKRRRFDTDQAPYSPWLARRIVAKYPVGATVNAYCSPTDPSKAVLERGISPFWLASCCAAAYILLIGARQQLSVWLGP
jgi:hypothetical protein